MYSASRVLVFCGLVLASILAIAAPVPLRVCSDPANLPFSNFRQQGFENKLALWMGRDLRRPIDFAWWPSRAHFVEKRLAAGQCDVVMGVPSTFAALTPSIPYYRSSYVFVSRRDRNLRLRTLHDPALHDMRIGLHLISDESESVPPAQELAANGMLKNIVGYSLYGRPLDANQGATLITAVAEKQIDVAVAWGPLAGFYAVRSPVPLRISQICEAPRRNSVPLQFDISIGVKKGESRLLRDVNGFIRRNRAGIRKLLAQYDVPLAGASSCR
jgi:mxaJ protein